MMIWAVQCANHNQFLYTCNAELFHWIDASNENSWHSLIFVMWETYWNNHEKAFTLVGTFCYIVSSRCFCLHFMPCPQIIVSLRIHSFLDIPSVIFLCHFDFGITKQMKETFCLLFHIAVVKFACDKCANRVNNWIYPLQIDPVTACLCGFFSSS